jgi:hypothetical protein
MPFLPVYNHRLGPGYITALLRAAGHEVVLLDLEHILRVGAADLSLRLAEQTEVYAENWAEQIQFLHRPELLFGALWPDDLQLRRELSASDWILIEDLCPHLRLWADAIVGLEPDLLLLPALVSNLWIVLWLGELVKRSHPRVRRVLGGRGLTYPETRELILRARWSEAVVDGEAESSIVALVEAVASGESGDSLVIPGLVRLAGDEVVQIQAGALPDLDRLPLPDYVGLPFPGASLRHYSDNGLDFHDAASIGGSRWCARHCAYCYESIYPKNYRLRQVSAVLREIEFQRAKLDTPRLFFCDSTINLSPRWLEDLADGMFGLSFKPQVVFAHCEPRRLGRRLLEKMRDAGFDKLNFGVETLDQRTLQRMDRDLTVEETEQTVLDAIEAGVSLGVNIVSNYPGETASEYENTMVRAAALAERVRKSAARTGANFQMMVSQARLDPHSSLFVNRDRFGIRIHRRSVPVPAPLKNLTSCIERIGLDWEDGLPRTERRSRFALMRRFIESLSIRSASKKVAGEPDHRVALDKDQVPRPLVPLVDAAIPESVRL